MKRVICLFCALAIIGITGGVIYSNLNKSECTAGRGCCSRHGGECGCLNGRSKCCDGTLSPSCQCFKDDVKGLDI